MSQHHPDDHDHNHDPNHSHEHEHGLTGWLLGLFSPHEHGHYAAALDPAMSNARAGTRGIWAVKVSLIALLATALFQVIIVLVAVVMVVIIIAVIIRMVLAHCSSLFPAYSLMDLCKTGLEASTQGH